MAGWRSRTNGCHLSFFIIDAVEISLNVLLHLFCASPGSSAILKNPKKKKIQQAKNSKIPVGR
jgi:hypothetical protein